MNLLINYNCQIERRKESLILIIYLVQLIGLDQSAIWLDIFGAKLEHYLCRINPAW